MKRQNFIQQQKWPLLFSLLFLLLAVLSFISCNNTASEDAAVQTGTGIPALLERKGDLAKAAEWPKTKEKVAELAGKIAQAPNDVKPRLQLATVYMSEGRITGNAYYNQATIQILNDVIAIDPNNFEAYVFKASEAMSLHQFAEAKKLAEKAQSINPDNAYVCGVLVDANVELGNYKEAIAMSDKMQALKPSLEAYSRASYLREIFGDYHGAIAAMTLAVEAGLPGSESAEWARVTLGDIYLNMGRLDSAQRQYETALSARPQFPNAEIGLAKVEKARKNYDKAIQHTENAIRIKSEASYIAQLGELYELKGDQKKATEVKNTVVEQLEQGEKEQDKAIMKHNANRELANAYLAAGKLDKALTFAQNDLALRPANIDANELVAWILYLKNDFAGAKAFADNMLATNTNNANTLYKAGLIYTRSGDAQKGSMLLAKAKSLNPYIDQHILLASR